MTNEGGEAQKPIETPKSTDKSNRSIIEVSVDQEKQHLPNNFQKIGGNTELAEAKIVCIGSSHTDMDQSIATGDFIDLMAQDSDIVLVEGISANEEINSKEHIDLTTVSKPLHVIGWDNIELRDQSLTMMKTLMSLQSKIGQAHEMNDLNKLSKLDKQFWELNKELNRIAITERNKSLTSTLNTVQKRYPNQRIFVLGGTEHFVKDPQLTTRLDRERYIVVESSPEDIDENQKSQKIHEYFAGENYAQGSKITAQQQIDEKANPVNPPEAGLPSNKIFTIEMPDGTTKNIGANWFANPAKVKPGDSVMPDNEYQDFELKIPGLTHGKTYKIKEIS